MARRTLARHWQARTPAERGEFAQLFGDLLERAYITKIDLYAPEKVAFVGESMAGNHATVRTRIVTKQGNEIPIDFRLWRQGEDRWRAYDVAIEGVSLVANYRAQFNAVIQKSSYEGLLRALKAKHDDGMAGGPGQKVQRANGTIER